MNRFNWSLVLGLTATVGLLACQNAAWGSDYADASPFSLASNPSTTTAPSVVQAPSTGCCPSACDGDCCRCRQWTVGVEGVWLTTQQHGTLSAATGVNDSPIIDSNSIDYTDNTAAELNGFYLTPRLTLGVQGEKWGLQVRYWRMNEPTTNSQTVDPALDTGYLVQNVFRAETLDFEVTRLFCLRETEFCASFGVRHAELEQSSLVSTRDIIAGETFLGYARAKHNFGGTGLTWALVGKRPVGCKNFNLYYSLRASVIWDDGVTNEAEARTTEMAGAYLDQGTYAATSQAASMFIGEFQVGGQWDFDLQCLRAKAFVRAGLEYQYWKDTNTGAAVASNGGSADNGVLFGAASAASTDAKVDLVGLDIATGLTW